MSTPHKKCSVCKKEGHNRATCPVLKDAIARSYAERLAAEKAEQAKRTAERLAAEEKAVQEKLAAVKAAERARVEAELEEQYQREETARQEEIEANREANRKRPWQPAKDPVLHLIFHLIYDPNATMEYMNLREHYAEHPEMFKIVGTEHYSNEDHSPHHTIEVRKVYHFKAPSGKLVTRNWIAYYHIYYTTFNGKRTWTDLTCRGRDTVPYTLAKFDCAPK
jgi:hypothetical protein